MKRLSAAAAGIGLLVASGGLVIAATTAASAATGITYEPDPNSVGTITFYDANGHVVTGGTIPSNDNDAAVLAAYEVGSNNFHGNDSKASLYFATPAAGDPSTWSKDKTGATYLFSPAPAGLPQPLASQTTAITPASEPAGTLPIYKGDPTQDDSITDWSDTVPNATTSNPNIYQVRLYTSNPSNASSAYDEADISINKTAHTWTLVYPTVTTTTTSLTSSAPASAATPISLTATDGSASVPGTVSFFDGTTVIGAPVAVSNGSATSPSFTPTVGTHSYTARFDPRPGYSDGTAAAGTLNEYRDSTSSAVSVVASGPVTTPPASLPEAPYAALLVLVGFGAVSVEVLRRRRSAADAD